MIRRCRYRRSPLRQSSGAYGVSTMRSARPTGGLRPLSEGLLENRKGKFNRIDCRCLLVLQIIATNERTRAERKIGGFGCDMTACTDVARPTGLEPVFPP